MNQFTITNVNIVTPSEILARGCVTVENGVITYIGYASPYPFPIIDGRGGTLIPGTIDLHIHGAHGFDMMDGTTHSIEEVSKALAASGCTAFLATSVTSSFEDLTAFIHNVRAVRGHEPGARIAGIHLEGPYLNKKRKGMQNEHYLRHPDFDEMKRLLEYGDGLIKMITIAPELPGGLDMVEWLDKQGVIVSIAHSDATYDEAKAAFRRGASHVTHCFNAMRPIHHRDPGVVIAAFEERDVTCEAIVDNIHLHPAIVRFMHRNLGDERMMLVTDAMQAMGLGDGQYTFGGHLVNVVDGVARLADGTLASSTVTLHKAIRCATQDGIDFFSAVQMATATPARTLGLDNKGVIREGADADLVLLNRDMEIERVIIGGEVVTER